MNQGLDLLDDEPASSSTFRIFESLNSPEIDQFARADAFVDVQDPIESLTENPRSDFNEGFFNAQDLEEDFLGGAEDFLDFLPAL